jgi:hypothetical protein
MAALPVGSFGQHGNHLRLVTDTMIAGVVGSEISAAYGLLLPPVAFGCSHEHSGLGATVSVLPDPAKGSSTSASRPPGLYLHWDGRRSTWPTSSALRPVLRSLLLPPDHQPQLRLLVS